MTHDEMKLALFMAHRGKLVNYASGIVGDRANAEDVVQEAYLRFEAAGERLLDDPISYLYRIVRNLAIDGRRKALRETRYVVRDADDLAEQTAEDAPSPETHAVDRDAVRVMIEAMAELPERTRVALEMHRFGGCTFKEIADHLHVSVGTAHALVIDGLEYCRAKLFR